MLKNFLIIFLITASTGIIAQSETDFCKQLSALKELINEYHFKPKPLDDSLSKGVHSLFLKNLDTDKILFNDADIAKFKMDQFQLDDYIKRDDCVFLDAYTTTLTKRLADTKEVILSYRDSSLDYTGVDSLKYYRTKESGYFDDRAAMEKYWNKRIRYEILVKMIEEDSLLSSIEKNFETLEQRLKPKVFERLLCQLDEIENKNGGLARFTSETFLNAYTNYQDPNTMFFNDTDKTMFENSVSTSFMTFGLYTDKNDDGEIVVSYVTPGSSAYFDGNIEESDVIRSLSSNSIMVETNCISNEEIYAFLSDANHPTVTFRVKKKDGSIKAVTLTKKEEKAIENLTRGYVVNKEFPVGYINIPSFYTDFESPNGLGVANDVAKEIYKLKKENVQGLIIDLRFNGGGSMKEAADLSGMFIDRGPLSIIKYKDGDTYTVRDTQKGVVFSKPIVIIVNSYSASASEFFASLMQDYNRAIIVGTPTYGKSSMQTIVPLDPSEELGYCKLTTDVFYRVTGASNQSVGVQPDIKYPSMYEGLDISERFSPYALSNDSVSVTEAHRPKRRIPIKFLREKSEHRMLSCAGFQKIKSVNNTMVNKYLKKDTVYALTLKNVYNDLGGYNELWKDFIQFFDSRKSTMLVSNTKATEEFLKFNEDETKINEFSLKELAGDIYVEEAYKILSDINEIK